MNRVLVSPEGPPYRYRGRTCEQSLRDAPLARARLVAADRVNHGDPAMLRDFFPVNGMLRADVGARDHHPPGGHARSGDLLTASA